MSKEQGRSLTESSFGSLVNPHPQSPLNFVHAEASTFTVAMLITHLTMDNFVWLGIMYAKPGLFAISLLASLNGRRTTSLALQESVVSSLLFPPLSSQGEPRTMTVNITTAHLTVSSDPEKAIPSKEELMSA
ncbi:hypothetical protein DL96DRAFT_1722130 [Flagelloscypha sp. PMI_526]|nr:hypothetical protein DL96DRAFT_1722130 [Flagelloscypha sp. PMI_526]